MKTWEEFDKLIFQSSWNKDIKRHRTNYVFRGVSNKNYALIPSLNRVCEPKLDLEKALLRNFKKYASMDIEDDSNFWKVVSLAQHHGLPTRLLDWTFSPYVAAHFATESYSDYNVDCAIWRVDFVKCQKYLPKSLKDKLDNENANGYSVDMLSPLVADFDALYKLENETGKSFPLFFEPPSIDSRIINQFALFSVMSNSSARIDEWLKEHSKLYDKIIIPASCKLVFRDRLDQINMTERLIYPGLDGLCKWLSRHYTPTDRIWNP